MDNVTSKKPRTLRAAIKSMNLSEVSGLAGLSLSSVCGYRKGNQDLSRPRMARMVFQLGLSPAEVYATLAEDYPDEYEAAGRPHAEALDAA